MQKYTTKMSKNYAEQFKTRDVVCWQKGIVHLHDSVRPHTGGQTCNPLYSFGWEVLDHLPYSPDFAPSDYRLFLNLKQHPSGNC